MQRSDEADSRVIPVERSHETVTVTRSVLGQAMTLGEVSEVEQATLAASYPDEPALRPGEELGGFRIERQLGVGGMGQVFAARPVDGGDLVALKYLERSSASMLYRFKQEFRALAGVTHSNLVALGQLRVLPDSTHFFTMELVDGVPFDDYVRGRTPSGELPNLARLRRALRQLVAGVRHLHKSGCVHRDLKPSNVLVTPEGRVVVLDFGLVQDSAGAGASDPEDQIMGTPAYMSPEQAGLERATGAADYYAVGVMLYECLTGKRPFRGTLTHLLFAKREFDPPEVTELVEGVPQELAELCRGLLARYPEDRPTGREILAALDGEEDVDELPSDASMVHGRVPFVGRHRELAALKSAFVALKERELGVSVHVRGRSGYGKSALVHEFLSHLRENHGAVVLRGRCLEREAVPYKGVDAVVDALSVHLRQLSREALLQLETRHPEALVRLFPVLGDLWAGDGAPTDGLDAHELRQRGVAALRELLAGLGQRRPLALFVDDFQWGDVDSARLLTELVRPPDAPRMLLVVAYRDEVAGNDALEALTADEAVADRRVEEIEVGPMPEAESRELALVLMGDEHDADRAAAYAAGAEGSPFYVGQMVRGAASEEATPDDLDQLVVRRILALPDESRRLLEVVAVAGAPIPRRAAFAASGLGDAAARLIPDRREAELLSVRAGSTEDATTLETAHDRIREVTVGELEPAQLRDTHLRVAQALERVGSDPEAMAEHFELGGDRQRAAEYYGRAAEQASNSLAFQRAAALFRRTLELLGDAADDQRRAELRSGLAEALIHVGRGHEAAQLLLQLAADAEARGEEAELRQAREYRRRAADQLIKTGHVDEGLGELDRLLRTVKMRLPSGKAAALSALVWEQGRARMRGFEFTLRPAASVPPELLDQIDTCFAVVNGLSTQEVLLSALFHLRGLRLALSAGEPYRVARALAYQCVFEVGGSSDWRLVDEHLRAARKLAGELNDAQLSGWIDLCEASCHWFERRYPTSAALHTRAIARLEGVAGAVWDRRTCELHHCWTLVCQGNYSEFRSRGEARIERARERGDMQEMIEMASFKSVVQVLCGDPEGARETLAVSQADWNPGRYLFGDVWAFYGMVRVLLWEGEVERAVALSRETVAQMRRTFLDQNRLANPNVQELLARSYLSAALARGHASYARRARRLAARLRSYGNPVLTAQAAVIDAGVASFAGRREAAMVAWEEAAALFESHGMRGQLAAVRARQAACLGEAEPGPSYRAEAEAYFESEGIADIEGFLRVEAPAAKLG